MPEAASAAPQPSQRHPGAVASFPVGMKWSPVGPVPAFEPNPSGTFRWPSGRTASSTVSLSMQTAGLQAETTAMDLVAVAEAPSLSVTRRLTV
jgi:hypothetical protein